LVTQAGKRIMRIKSWISTSIRTLGELSYDYPECCIKGKTMETPERKTKQFDEIFCWSCGEIIKKEAVICVHCGVQVRPLAPQVSPLRTTSGSPFASAEVSPKNKITAVLLAVFLGYWTWLYTFDRDKIKFLIGILLNFLTILMYITNYTLIAQFLLIGPFCIWVYSIIDVSVKSKTWYDNYPSG
jgi:hypothetical protein